MKTLAFLFLLFVAVLNMFAANIAIYKGMFFAGIVFFIFTLFSVLIAKRIN